MKVEVPKDFKPAQHMRGNEQHPSIGLLEYVLVEEYLRQVAAKKTAERPKAQSLRTASSDKATRRV